MSIKLIILFNIIQNYIASQPNTYEQAQGELVFDRLEYEQVPGPIAPTNGSIQQYTMSNANRLKSDEYQYTGDLESENVQSELETYVEQCKQEALGIFKSVYCAVYNPTSDTYDYSSNAITYLNP